MALTIVTEPATEPLTLEEIEEHLRLSETSTGSEDDLLLIFLTAARRYCELDQSHAYIEQTWNLVLDDFPRGGFIKVPRPPLMSVTHVKSYGIGGTAVTMTAGRYYVDTDSKPGGVHLVSGESWPSTPGQPASGVEVQFVAGYGSAASSVPGEVKQAIQLVIGHMYEHREGSDVARMSPEWIKKSFVGVDAILGLDRIWKV